MSNASRLRGSRFGIDRDYPAEISSARKLLWNRLKDLKSEGKDVVLEYPARLVIGRRVVEDAFPDWYDVLRTKRVEPTISEEVKAANDRAEARRQNRNNLHEQSSWRVNTTTNRWPNTATRSENVNTVNSSSNDNSSRANSTGYNRIVNEQRRNDDDEDAAFYSDYVNSRMRPPDQHVAWGAGASGVARSASEGSGVPRLNDQDYPPLNYKHVQGQRSVDVDATNLKYVAGSMGNSFQNNKSNGAGASNRGNGEQSDRRNNPGQIDNGGIGGTSAATGTANNRQKQTMTNEREIPRTSASK